MTKETIREHLKLAMNLAELTTGMRKARKRTCGNIRGCSFRCTQ